MTRIEKIVSITALLLSQLAFGQQPKAVIEYEAENPQATAYSLSYFLQDHVEDDLKIHKLPAVTNSTRQIVRWEIGIDSAVIISGTTKFPFKNAGFPLEPGDSAYIKKTGDAYIFSGNAAPKLELIYKLANVGDNAKMRSLRSNRLDYDSITDFQYFFEAFRDQLSLQLDLLERYRSRISNFTYCYLKGYYLHHFRYYTHAKFLQFLVSRDKFLLPLSHFGALYDSTLANYWPSPADTSDFLYLAPYTGRSLKKMLTVKMNMDAMLAGTYDPNDDDGNNIIRYDTAKRQFQGLAQRKVLAHMLRSMLSDENSATVQRLAKDFISLPGYLSYHNFINERLERSTKYQVGRTAPAFSLPCMDGAPITSETLRGKIVVMDFWFTGCKGCVTMAPVMKKVEQAFKNIPQVVFLNISVDRSKEQWVNSVKKGKYTAGTGINVYTGGEGKNHAILKDFDVSSYPRLHMLDQGGKFLVFAMDPRDDNGASLIQMIKKMLPVPQEDGPYVLDGPNGRTYKSVVEDGGKKSVQVSHTAIAQKAPNSFKVSLPYSGKSFTVKIRPTTNTPPAEYKMPSKLLAISDIEGNFDAFESLLIAGGVIDDQFNWTFGDGHLVLLGDFFDRGHQVTEVLWLIYALEEKARQNDGMVHFILGNHELMNLSGHLKYVSRKYTENAKLLNEDYATGLYGVRSELGRWIRTKNVIEKIGNVLFAHGGISAPINQSSLSVSEINETARPWYDKSTNDVKDSTLTLVMDNETSPFWYRGYYDRVAAPTTQIDSTLAKFGVDRIVTGHTIVQQGKKVTAHYAGKVINVDTHHALGHSAALMIENGQFYSMDSKGRRKPLQDIDPTKHLATGRIR